MDTLGMLYGMVDDALASGDPGQLLGAISDLVDERDALKAEVTALAQQIKGKTDA